MINFRYHVVSLTAVFLALAIGLVVGTAALNGPVADSLKDQVTALSKDNSNYRDQANQYRDELNRAQDFATQVSGPLLSGKLTGRRVAAGRAARCAAGLPETGSRRCWPSAGAKVTATVTVQDKFFDPTNNVELLDLADAGVAADRVRPARCRLNSDGVETSSALLALALLQKTPEPSAQADLTAVLTAYTQGRATSRSTRVRSPNADSTVIVSGLPPVDKDATKKTAVRADLHRLSSPRRKPAGRGGQRHRRRATWSPRSGPTRRLVQADLHGGQRDHRSGPAGDRADPGRPAGHRGQGRPVRPVRQGASSMVPKVARLDSGAVRSG